MLNCDIFSSNFFWNQYVVDFLCIFFFFQYRKKNEMRRFLGRNEMRAAYWKQTWFFLALSQKPEIAFNSSKGIIWAFIVLLLKTALCFALVMAFSWETDLWVTLDDFTVKTQIWEGKSVFNWKSIKQKRNVMCSR